MSDKIYQYYVQKPCGCRVFDLRENGTTIQARNLCQSCFDKLNARAPDPRVEKLVEAKK